MERNVWMLLINVKWVMWNKFIQIIKIQCKWYYVCKGWGYIAYYTVLFHYRSTWAVVFGRDSVQLKCIFVYFVHVCLLSYLFSNSNQNHPYIMFYIVQEIDNCPSRISWLIKYWIELNWIVYSSPLQKKNHSGSLADCLTKENFNSIQFNILLIR